MHKLCICIHKVDIRFYTAVVRIKVGNGFYGLIFGRKVKSEKSYERENVEEGNFT